MARTRTSLSIPISPRKYQNRREHLTDAIWHHQPPTRSRLRKRLAQTPTGTLDHREQEPLGPRRCSKKMPHKQEPEIPHVMAALRNTALAVLRFDGQTKIAETLRFFDSDPKLAVKLIQQILKLNNPAFSLWKLDFFLQGLKFNPRAVFIVKPKNKRHSPLRWYARFVTSPVQSVPLILNFTIIYAMSSFGIQKIGIYQNYAILSQLSTLP